MVRTGVGNPIRLMMPTRIAVVDAPDWIPEFYDRLK